jgi:hypothetical protein
MFDKVIDDKEVLVKVFFTHFGNQFHHQLVIQGKDGTAIGILEFACVCHQHYLYRRGQASDWQVNQLQVDVPLTICITYHE